MAQRVELPPNVPPEQAAALIAAVERFVAETTPVATTDPVVSGWQRAALVEGVGAKAAFVDPWGEPRGWGSRYGRG